MRLVDADKFNAELQKEIEFAKQTGMPQFVMGMNKVKEMLDSEPTAYDLEMVIEDLEHEGYEEHDEDWKWHYDEAIENAMKIVKSGVKYNSSN